MGVLCGAEKRTPGAEAHLQAAFYGTDKSVPLSKTKATTEILTLRLRSGQAPSTSLRAGSFDFAQGRLLRLRSGQAPSTSLRAGSFDFAQSRLLSTSLRAGSFRSEERRVGDER